MAHKTAEPTAAYPRFNEPPIAWFADQQSVFDLFSVRIQRRNPKGQIATLYGNVSIRPGDMPALDEFVRAHAGGGDYTIIVSDPQNLTTVLCSYAMKIEGRIRPPLPLDSDAQPAPEVPASLMMLGGFAPHEVELPLDMMQQMPPEHLEALAHAQALAELHQATGAPTTAVPEGYPPATDSEPVPHAPIHPEETPPMTQPTATPPWAQSLPPVERAAFATPAAAQRVMGLGSIASDALAKSMADQATAENARLREQNEALRREQAAIQREMERKLSEEREARLKQEHKAEMAAMEARLLASAKSAPASNPLELVVPLITALAPVLGEMVRSSAATQNAQLQAQQTQQAAMLTTFAAMQNKPEAPPADPLAGAERMMQWLAPFLTQQSRPDASQQVELIRVMGEQQMQMAGMSANLIGALAEAQAPPEAEGWIKQLVSNGPAIAKMIGGVGDLFQKMNQGPMLAPAMLPPGPSPMHVPVRPITPAPAPTHATVPAANTAAPAPNSSAPTIVTHATGYDAAEDEPESTVSAADGSGPIDPRHEDVGTEPVPVNIAQIAPFLPPELTTSAWKMWVREFHRGSLPSEVGEALAELVMTTDFDEEHVTLMQQDLPGFLERMGSLLPMGQANPLYLQRVVYQTSLAITAAIEDQDDQDGESDETDDADDGEHDGQDDSSAIVDLTGGPVAAPLA